MRAPELLVWLASLPPSARDAAVEEHLGIAGMASAASAASPGDHLIGYHASGVASIVRALIEVPVTASDVVVDIGAGLGKVLMLTRLLTGATARGIEIQEDLAAHAHAAAARLGIDIDITAGDARGAADVEDATVFFLYVPFTGPVVSEVLARLHAVARRRAIVVCTLGLELEREAPWLAPRSLDSFWLSIYDSVVPDVPPRPSRERASTLGHTADAIAFERSAD